MKAIISRAQSDDSQRLTEIAHAAKRHWGYPERWIAAWKDALTITPDFISSNEVYAATIDGEIAGFYALIAHGSKVVLEHMWVMPERIGTGLGKELFNHAVDTARRLSAEIMEIESDPYAEGFYKRMGAKRMGEVVSELEGQPRVLPLLIFDVERNPTLIAGGAEAKQVSTD